MDGISAIGGAAGGYFVPPSVPAVSAAATPQTAATAPAGASALSLASMSSTSISASMQSFAATYGPALSSNELLGAVLLMLTLEYMKPDKSDSEKKDLLAVILALAQQQQGNSAGSGSIAYTSSSLSIETTQYQGISVASGIGAYSGAAANPQFAPAVDAGSAGLDVSA